MNHALIDVSIILIGEIQFDLNDNSQHLLESQFNTFNVGESVLTYRPSRNKPLVSFCI